MQILSLPCNYPLTTCAQARENQETRKKKQKKTGMWLVKSELYWQSCIRKISHHLFTPILHLALGCATVQPSDDLTQNIKDLQG